MRTLAIDIETFSSVDLTRCGVYKYTESPDFEILLFSYAFDDEEVTVIDLAQGEKVPDEVMMALTDSAIIKTAFNANFERTCLAKYFNIPMPPNQWRCSAVHALTLGLPGSLEGVAKCLNLSQQKMKEGKALIRYFSVPCKPTKANGERTRNFPKHDIEKWQNFKDYCKRDVEVERVIRKKLESYPMIEKELRLWQLDQKINDTGVRVDKVLVDNAIKCDRAYQDKLLKEAIHLTGLENPNSPAQLKEWLEKEGIKIESLSKEKVVELLEQTKNPKIKRVLELRQDMSKTSVKKYEAMDRSMCSDERIRGLLQFYGANRTGRWAGRLVQIHNLPRNNMKDLSLARQLLKDGDYGTLELLFDSVPDLLSQLIRTAFIPSENSRFIVADFSAIEARVIAWLAGEKWRMDVFNSHGKIYEASASQMFKVPIESITKGSSLRQKGKIAELALGYGGSKGALIAMGALNMGLTEEELSELVSAWRKSNPNIVKLWWDLEMAAIKSVKEKSVVTMQYGLKFYYKNGMLFIRLPSGRNLAYVRPRIEIDERFNKEMLTYEGIEQGTKKRRRLSTYGGKLVENITQAIARDCLAEAMLGLDEAGYNIVFHVHDEVVLDVPNGIGSLEEVKEIMGRFIDWAPGLPLKADGFETEFYKKD
ncbi:DNA polymerase [Caloranaerobacter ferrireducens]|uniref:DNA polymerase n=1 Tax=Caloranaerobacter ferrireducens TaxID=1323370 RepID=UPI00084DADDF|nr:DNA polymerase [Caloranaerobacter ferrireducens]